jgi:anti-sigma factor RsiW
MSTEADIRDEDLHAFIDDELGEAERPRVEASLAADPDLALRAGSFRADKSRLLSLYGGGLNEPLPREWIARIEEATARKRWPIQMRAIMALAASFVLILVGVIALRQFGRTPVGDIAADALAARADAIKPASVIPVTSARVAANEAAVMTRTLAAHVKAPDLTRMGYRLVSIDEYSAPARAFELSYRDASGRVFTLYLRRSSGATRFDLFRAKGLRICVWQDDVVGAVMAGPMSAPEMLRLASLTYTGLEM